jgi:hypothetical protein
MRVTARGLREELHVERAVSGSAADLLVVESQARGRLPAGLRFEPLTAVTNRLPISMVRRGPYVGLPIRDVRAGTVMDPSFAVNGFYYVNSDHIWYPTAHTTSDSGGAAIDCGQRVELNHYYIYRSMLKFDTTSVPDGITSTITQVNLAMECSADASDTDFDVNILKHDWSAEDPIDSAGKRETTYDACIAATPDSSIWRNTSGMAEHTLYTSGNLATSWIDKGGYTYYSLHSSRDKNEDQPTGAEWIVIDDATVVLVVAYQTHLAFRCLVGVGR